VVSRVMRTCYGRMLKFIRYVRNKLAVSSEVVFGGDRRRCMSLRRIESNLATKKCIADALSVAELLVLKSLSLKAFAYVRRR